MIDIKNMPHTTVEQVVRFRAEAISQVEILQKQVETCRRALASAAIPLHGIKMIPRSDLAKTEIETAINAIDQALVETSFTKGS